MKKRLWILLFLLPLGAAWAGTDFSPGFTMMFLFASLVCCAAGEAAERCLAGRTARAFGAALTASGFVLAIPAILIYAAGDDDFSLDLLLAVVLGLLFAVLVSLLLQRAHALTAWQPCESFLGGAAAALALLCGSSSTALLPCGAGLLLLAIARALPADRAAAQRYWLFFAGLCLAAVFAAAPLCFPGR